MEKSSGRNKITPTQVIADVKTENICGQTEHWNQRLFFLFESLNVKLIIFFPEIFILIIDYTMILGKIFSSLKG